jgi:hypothetical protein
MAMDPKKYIAVMRHWLDIFQKGPRAPVLGMTEEALRSIKVPTLIVPGNDNTHASSNGIEAARLIEGSILYRLPIDDLDVPLLPFTEWAPYEAELAGVLTDFMKDVESRAARR